MTIERHGHYTTKPVCSSTTAGGRSPRSRIRRRRRKAGCSHADPTRYIEAIGWLSREQRKMVLNGNTLKVCPRLAERLRAGSKR